MWRSVTSGVFKFVASTLEKIALVFLVVGVVNPYIERQPLPLEWGGFNTSDKLRDLGFEPINPGINLNWLLTAAVIYLIAMIAIGVSHALDDRD